MTLSAVAEKTGLTRAGARRFLHTLVELGYARQEGKQFSLTPRVLELGFAYLSSLGLSEVLSSALKQVSSELDESCSACVLDGIDIVYIARIFTRRIMSVNLGIGARLPAALTSMGRVLLAHSPPEAVERCLASFEPAALTPQTITTKPALRKLLEKVKAEGYCIVDGELESGLRSIAVPVFDREGEVVAAMNVSAHAVRVDVETMRNGYLPVLRRAARAISDQIVA